jgi:hypothetical protein
MKKNLILFTCLGVLFTSYVFADVSGKRYEAKIETFSLIADFDKDSDKVFYISDVGTYNVDGENVVINFNGRQIKFSLIGNKLCPYDYDENGNQTDKLSKDLFFVESGISNYFTNVFVNQSKSVDEVTINFTEDEAFCGENKISYSFDKETGKYSAEGFEPTADQDLFVQNVLSALINKSLGGTASELTYEKGWWLRQKVNDEIDDDMLEVYVSFFYPKEFDEAKKNDFALNRLINEKKTEFEKKYQEVNTKENFRVIKNASLGKYDFDNNEFKINTDLSFDEIESTFSGYDIPLEVRLGSLSKSGWYGPSISWYSDIRTKVVLEISTEEAEKLSNENSSYLIAYELEPIMYLDQSDLMGEIGYDRWFDAYQARYIQYYSIKSADLIDKKTLKSVGKVTIPSAW